jgi:hypothetical protein
LNIQRPCSAADANGFSGRFAIELGIALPGLVLGAGSAGEPASRGEFRVGFIVEGDAGGARAVFEGEEHTTRVGAAAQENARLAEKIMRPQPYGPSPCCREFLNQFRLVTARRVPIAVGRVPVFASGRLLLEAA